MKLLIAVFLASCLLLKAAEGADGDIGASCQSGDICKDISNAECTGATGSKTCNCRTNYEKPSGVVDKCLKSNLKYCDLDADCAKGKCDSTDTHKCGLAKDASCSANGDCASNKCESTKCAAGSGTITASLMLLMMAVLTSRFL